MIWATWLAIGAVALWVNQWLPLADGEARLLTAAAALAAGLLLQPRGGGVVARAGRLGLAATLTLAAALVLAWGASGTGLHYDTAFYQLPALRWAWETVLPEGLGLLHFRLGHASLHTFASAALASPAWPTVQLATPLLAAALLGDAFARARDPENPARALYAAWIALVLLWRPTFGTEMASAGRDLPVALLLSAGSLRWMELARLPRGTRPRAAAAAQAWAMLVGASAIKLSCAPAAAVATLALGRELLAGLRRGEGRVYRFALLGIVVAGVGGFLLAGYRLTGCLAYPSRFACLDVPWAIPAATAAQDLKSILGASRRPGAELDVTLASWDWLVPWFTGIFLRSSLVVACAGAWAVAWSRRARRPSARPRAAIPAGLALAHGVTAAIWWARAPDPRFLWGTLLWLATAGLAAAVPEIFERALRGRGRALAGAVVLVVAARLGIAAARGGQGVPPVPQAEVVVWVAPVSGQSFFRPRLGDQCGWGPLTCTPYPQAGLGVVPAPGGTGRLRFELRAVGPGQESIR